jgi:hypothetical protein
VAAWAMHATVSMQAWPTTAPCPFSFLPPPRNSHGSAHLCALAWPNSFPPTFIRLKI